MLRRSHPETEFFATSLLRELGLIVVFLFFLPTSIQATEINLFKFENVKGYSILNAFANTYDKNTNNLSNTDGYNALEQKFNLYSDAYFYHPKFIKLELSTTPVFSQSMSQSDGTRQYANSSLFQLDARMRFLKEKPYPLVMYYNRITPTTFINQTERLSLRNSQYGATFYLRRPYFPIGVNAEIYKRTSQGNGELTYIDNQSEQADISLSSYAGKDGRHTLKYRWNQYESRSRSSSLPLLATSLNSNSLTMDSQISLGQDKQFRLANNAYALSQLDMLKRNYARYGSRLNWHHDSTRSSVYEYAIQYNQQAQNSLLRQNAKVGINLPLANVIQLTLDVHAERNQTKQYSLNNLGNRVLGKFNKNLGWGKLRSELSTNVDFYSQKSFSQTVASFTEQHNFPDDQIIILQRVNIVATSVVVYNSDRTLMYVLDQDYEVLQIGDQVQIIRLVTGTIGTGEQVYVDYNYATGGTYDYTDLSTTAFLQIETPQNLATYIRLHQAKPVLLHGEALHALNDKQNIQLGMRLAHDMTADLKLNGDILLEGENNPSFPYTRQQIGIDLQFFEQRIGRFAFAAGYERMLYIQTNENRAMQNASFGFRSKTFHRLHALSNLRYERVRGDFFNRDSLTAHIGAQWHIRKSMLSFDMRIIDEFQSGYRQTRSSMLASFKREF